MWLLSKTDSRDNGGYQGDVGMEWSNIPKNPVFYPPTPRKDDTAAFIHESPVVPERRRSGNLLTRLKTMFIPKVDQILDEKPRLRRTSNSLKEASMGTGKLRAFRRSRLVARSAVREDSISPDLRALADIEYIPNNVGLPLEHRTSPPHTTNLTSMSYAHPRRRPLDRLQFAKSVYSPCGVSQQTMLTDQAYGGLDTSSIMIYNNTLHFAPHPTDTPASCLQGVARSQSMTMPSRHPGLMHRLEPMDEQVSGSRTSHGSDFTAIPDADMSTNETHLCGEYDDDSEDSDTDDIIRTYLGLCVDTDSDDIDGARASYSPSQRTLRATESYIDEYADSVKTDADLIACSHMAMSEIDIFATLSRSVRRPHSERFPNRVTPSDSELLCYHRNELDMFPELSSGQRAMYIRTSCADSDLVKSTFDLAKLLPSAPR